MTPKRSVPLAAAASSTRRAFLKFGAMAAAPLAGSAALAAPALAGGDTAERLARLEDMESLRALHASLLRAINTNNPTAARALFVDPAQANLDPNIRTIALNNSSPAKRGVSRGPQDKTRSVLNGERPSGFREGWEGTTRSVVEGAAASQPSPEGIHITLAEDRQTATLTAPCTVHTETPIDSDCTLVQMARLQGEGFIRSTSPRTLEARFVKQDGAWKVESAAFSA